MTTVRILRPLCGYKPDYGSWALRRDEIVGLDDAWAARLVEAGIAREALGGETGPEFDERFPADPARAEAPPALAVDVADAPAPETPETAEEPERKRKR